MPSGWSGVATMSKTRERPPEEALWGEAKRDNRFASVLEASLPCERLRNPLPRSPPRRNHPAQPGGSPGVTLLVALLPARPAFASDLQRGKGQGTRTCTCICHFMSDMGANAMVRFSAGTEAFTGTSLSLNSQKSFMYTDG